MNAESSVASKQLNVSIDYTLVVNPKLHQQPVTLLLEPTGPNAQGGGWMRSKQSTSPAQTAPLPPREDSDTPVKIHTCSAVKSTKSRRTKRKMKDQRKGR